MRDVPKDPVVGVRLPEQLVAQIDRVAKEQDRSRSWVIRRVLVEALRDGGAR